MKRFFLLLILNSSFLTINCLSQQYGWVDISNNLPSSNGTASLSDMHWINESEGWICSGALGEIYHTTDGGQTFETQTTQYYTNAIYMINSQLGYAGGIQGRVYKTTNGGADWIIHGSIGSTLLDIDFPPNSDSGYCCGYNGKIYKITPTEISAMSSGVVANLSSMTFPANEGWTCGENVILHYVGSLWTGDQSYNEGTYSDIYMMSVSTGWAVGDNGVIIRTSNGLNWNPQSNPDALNRTLLAVFFLNVNEGWAAGFNGIVLNTTNGGIDWDIILDGWTTNMLRSVQFTSSTNGYILGNNKTLFKYGLLTDVEEQPTHPTEFKLEQNYPNPFNPTTKIKYSIPSVGTRLALSVQLIVYDVIGNEIATLVNEENAPGTYEVEFNPASRIKNPASGIYFYQLKAGDYLETKKMILLK